MNATEAMILEKMNVGTFKVCVVTKTVSFFHLKRKRWYTKKLQYHTRTGRASVVFNGGNRIYLNRLMWMWLHREVPSEVIDHKDLDRTNDSPDNLQPMSWNDSNRQGYEAMKQRQSATYAEDIGE